MRTLARALSNVMLCLSLLAFVATCALWVRSEFACDVGSRTDAAGEDTAICSASGCLQFTRVHTGSPSLTNPFTSTANWGAPPAAPPTVAHGWQWTHSPPSQALYSRIQPGPGDAAVDARVLVLVARSSPVYAPSGYSGGYSGLQPPMPSATQTVLSVSTPYWFLAAVTILWPLARGARWYANRRRAASSQRGVCRNCGYDLRATPGRCPECGTVPPAKGIA